MHFLICSLERILKVEEKIFLLFEKTNMKVHLFIITIYFWREISLTWNSKSSFILPWSGKSRGIIILPSRHSWVWWRGHTSSVCRCCSHARKGALQARIIGAYPLLEENRGTRLVPTLPALLELDVLHWPFPGGSWVRRISWSSFSTLRLSDGPCFAICAPCCFCCPAVLPKGTRLRLRSFPASFLASFIVPMLSRLQLFPLVWFAYLLCKIRMNCWTFSSLFSPAAIEMD